MCDKSQSFGRRGRTSTEVRRNISELWLVFDNTLNTLQFHQNTTLQLYNVYNKCIGDDTKAVTRPNPNCIKKTKQNKIKYGEKRFSTLPMELLNPAMWHVALGSWHWIRQVATPCNAACGSGIITVNSPSDSTLQCDTSLWDDKIQDGGDPPSWILGVQYWVLWKAHVRLPCR